MKLHRAMLALMATALLTVVAGLAVAEDEIGIFFDQVATENCIDIGQSTTTLDAYLLLLEPTTSVFGWECSVEVENAFVLEVDLAGQAVNVGSGDEYVVGLSSPLPANTAVQLARMSVMVVTGDQAGFYIFPVTLSSLDGTPSYADGGNPEILLPMTPHTIGANSLVAGINLPNCIPTESTWGRVKTIYYD